MYWHILPKQGWSYVLVKMSIFYFIFAFSNIKSLSEYVVKILTLKFKPKKSYGKKTNFHYVNIAIPWENSPNPKNQKMDPKSKGKLKYLKVGKVLGATKKLGSWELFGRFWPKKVQNWTKWEKSISAALRVTQDHSFTRFKALSVNLTLKVHFLSLEGKI